MTGQFPTLFTPITLGNVEIKNRILSTGHDTVLAENGRVSDALVAYHAARARGGVGLIVGQVTGVHATSHYTSRMLVGFDDDCIPGFARLAEAVHEHGTKFFVQLFHPGREISESHDGTIPVGYAPSAVPNERFHVFPRAMSAAMISEIVQCYGAAARRMRQAGVDGVELVASHGYLLAQFLNPKTNLRSDAYGGALENRLRALREVIAAVRAEAGADFALGLRISGDERDPNGLTEDIVLDAIAALAGDLDYVNVIAGSSASLGGAVHIVPPLYVETGYLAPFAARVKRMVDIPVLVAGRINQPQMAEAILAAGQADMCGMTRALICDPAMPAKAEAGRPDDIRACIGCNQACIGHFHQGVGISCIQHPETGRELAYGAVIPTPRPKRVMVIGGGPAGMKAAETAARRGHEVALYEASGQLGGQVLLAQLIPGRAEFGGLATNLAREMELAGVEVHLNAPAGRTMVEAEAPDAVILATGGKPYWPIGLEADDDAHIVTAWQVLKAEANPGGSVVIADWRCDWVGLGLAELLAASGRRVRLAVNGLHAGQNLQSYVRDTMAARAQKLGVEVIPYARLYGADADTAFFQHSVSGEPIVLEDTETLVLAQGQEPNDALLKELEGLALPVIPIGDCLAPRSAEEAVYDGLKAAWAL